MSRFRLKYRYIIVRTSKCSYSIQRIKQVHGDKLGFILAFTCLSAFLLKLEGESWLRALAVASATGVGFYLFFVRLLSVTLPLGPLGF